jgi:hypothetical protein
MGWDATGCNVVKLFDWEEEQEEEEHKMKGAR